MILHNDFHLNTFINYSDNYQLENNITKALIIALKSLNNLEILKFLKKCYLLNDYRELKSKQTSLHFEFYLQKKPSDEDLGNIKKLSKKYKKLLAFSPTGKVWDKKALSINYLGGKNKKENISKLLNILDPDIEKIKKDDKDLYKEKFLEAENEYNTIINIRNNKGDSIPDGWILIKNDQDLLRVIILENKKWDLDPYQLTNHIEKSLFVNYDQSIISLVNYDNIYKFFLEIIETSGAYERIILKDFLEYFTILGYEPSDLDLIVKSAEELDEIIRTSLAKKCNNIISKFCTKAGYSIERGFERIYPNIDDDNINVCCFIYYNKDRKLTIEISSEIGVRYKDYNCKLFNRLFDNKEYVDNLISIYQNCYWYRYCKIGQVAGTKYVYLSCANSLEEYLDEIKSSKRSIYCRMNKKELCKEFPEYKDDFARFNSDKKGVLEYLRIVSFKYYENNEVIKYADLEKYLIDEINKHILGLQAVNKIAKLKK